MEPIRKPDLDKSIIRTPAHLKHMLEHGDITTYDAMQMMGNTVNASADEVNRATDWVNKNGKILAENEEERIENEKEREEAEQRREAAEALRQETFETNEAQRQETFDGNERNRWDEFNEAENDRQQAFEEHEREFAEIKQKASNAVDMAGSAANTIDIILNGSDDPEKSYDLMMTHYALKHEEGRPANEFVLEFKESDAQFVSRYVTLKANMKVRVDAMGGDEIGIKCYRIFDTEGTDANTIKSGTRVLLCESATGTMEYNVPIDGNYLFWFSDGEQYIIDPTEHDVDVPVEHRPAAALYVTHEGLMGLQKAVFELTDKVGTAVDEAQKIADKCREDVDAAIEASETRVNTKMDETLAAVNKRADEVIAKAVRTSTAESVLGIL